jgi:hypothetical protein
MKFSRRSFFRRSAYASVAVAAAPLIIAERFQETTPEEVSVPFVQTDCGIVETGVVTVTGKDCGGGWQIVASDCSSYPSVAAMYEDGKTPFGFTWTGG